MATTARQHVPTPRLEVPSEVARDLERVEERLQEELASREPRLEEIAWHLVGAGGKRTRPLVVLLTFQAAAAAGTTRRRDDAIEAAVALELIHSATLLHDDIIDGNETRRGRPSAVRRYGLADALVAGDYLFCRAFALCARFEEVVIRWAGEACVALTEGEILQGRFRHNPRVTLEDYREIVDRKTAVLFATGARTAAHLAQAEASLVTALDTCGRHLGVAFQMQDDLLDVDGDTGLTGKPRGLDLRDGNPSLPIVLALARDGQLARTFASDAPSAQDVDMALDRLRAPHIFAEARALIRQESAGALRLLTRLPPSPARDLLVAIVEGLEARTQ